MSKQQFQHFIGGEWVDSGAFSINRNPANPSDVIGEYAQGTSTEVESAIQAAKAGFGQWSTSGLEARKAVLDQIGHELIERSQEIGLLLSREEGKAVAEAAGEVYRSGQFFHRFTFFTRQ